MNVDGKAVFFQKFVITFFLFIAFYPAMTRTAVADGREQLHIFYRDIHSLRGEFKQVVVDAQQKVTEQASGDFMLQRPGKFRWDYRTPYSQVIVADGTKVWFYDKDLEQVTVKNLGDTIGDTPAQLLSRTETLERNFIVTDAGTQDGLERVELVPRDENSTFEKATLSFAQGELRAMVLVDRLGQTTHLQFFHVERNPKLAPALFHFQPPAGVDVVGE